MCVNNDIGMGYHVSITPTGMKRNCYIFGSGDVDDFPLQNQLCKNETHSSGNPTPSTWVDGGPYLRWAY